MSRTTDRVYNATSLYSLLYGDSPSTLTRRVQEANSWNASDIQRRYIPASNSTIIEPGMLVQVVRKRTGLVVAEGIVVDDDLGSVYIKVPLLEAGLSSHGEYRRHRNNDRFEEFHVTILE